MRTKQLPDDFSDWIKARTFEIDAKMSLEPDLQRATREASSEEGIGLDEKEMVGTELQSGAAHCRVKDTTRRRTAQFFSFCGNAVTTNCMPPNFATAGQRRHIVLTRMAPQARVAAAAGS